MLGEVHGLSSSTVRRTGRFLALRKGRTALRLCRLAAVASHRLLVATIVTGIMTGQIAVPTARAAGNHAAVLYQDRIVALEFHDVSAKDKSTWTLTPQRFDRLLTELQSAGFAFVSAPQVEGFLCHQDKVPSNALFVTFDDGLMDDYTCAFPILVKHHIPFLFTIIGNRVGHGFLYLGPAEIRAMVKSGYATLGAHSCGLHSSQRIGGRLVPRMLGYLPDETDDDRSDRLFRDGEAVQREITAITGTTTPWYAWPFGAYDQLSQRAMSLAGFRYFLTSFAGSISSRSSDARLPRIDIGENRLSYRAVLTEIVSAALSSAQPPVRSGVSAEPADLAALRREERHSGAGTVYP